ncbi:MAG TPA: hypothetical protein PK466_00085 [Thermotogota bacterium]|nr:hypothetical protein [Thermotogota bacterium]HPJ87490.1 hypothetical protein [Thermotogota bacterium]HPR94695.1 hypothetical protein [Thermotogota bacterium]
MKKAFVIVLFLSLFVLQIFAIVDLNLVGEWKREVVAGHSESGGMTVPGNIGSFVITEQNGLSFCGYKLIDTPNVKGLKEDFSGVIAYDGKKLYIAEHHDGYFFVDVVTEDLMYGYYLEANEAKAIIVRLERIK